MGYCTICEHYECIRPSHEFYRQGSNSAFKSIRTQKATGVAVLQYQGWEVVTHSLVSQDSDLEMAWDHIQMSMERRHKKVFARPCPVRPRHGFVDSRPVATIDEAREVFHLAQGNDPEAEMLLMPMIDADLNAIWTPGAFVFGPGHDGATSGHESVTIPLVQSNDWITNTYTKGLLRSARINEPDVPYFEMVSDKQQVWFTQMRGGPRISSIGPDFIPEKMKVKYIRIAEGDLLEWEEKTATFWKGTVVYHPGGSMASHYAIHCKLHNIPIITSFEPKMGDVLEPTTQLPPIDMDSVVEGIGDGMSAFLKVGADTKAAVSLLLTGFHNVAAFSGKDGYWLGVAAGLMQRLGTAGLLGEARHATARECLNRDEIYNRAFEDPFKARREMRRAVWMFGNYPWRSGYGGNAWYTCGQALIDLDEEMRQFVVKPVKYNFHRLVARLNTAVNVAHNGGWWLNKFCAENLLDLAVQGYPTVQSNSLPFIQTLRQVSPEETSMALTKYRIAQPITVPEQNQIPKIRREAPAVPGTVTPVTYVEPSMVHTANYAQARAIVEDGKVSLHIQYKIAGVTQGDNYKTKDLSFGELLHFHGNVMHCPNGDVVQCITKTIVNNSYTYNSLAKSSTQYVPLPVIGGWIILPACGTKLVQIAPQFLESPFKTGSNVSANVWAGLPTHTQFTTTNNVAYVAESIYQVESELL